MIAESKASGTPKEVIEAFASAVNNEDLLRDALRDVGVPEPEKFSSVIELTQAFVNDKLPRFKAAPMLPVTLWVAWGAAHQAGRIWDRHFHNGKPVLRKQSSKKRVYAES